MLCFSNKTISLTIKFKQFFRYNHVELLIRYYPLFASGLLTYNIPASHPESKVAARVTHLTR